jgi:hypothetical protein
MRRFFITSDIRKYKIRQKIIESESVKRYYQWRLRKKEEKYLEETNHIKNKIERIEDSISNLQSSFYFKMPYYTFS